MDKIKIFFVCFFQNKPCFKQQTADFFQTDGFLLPSRVLFKIEKETHPTRMRFFLVETKGLEPPTSCM